MKNLSKIFRTDNCWNRFGIEYVVWDIFIYSVSTTLSREPTAENFWITKLATTNENRLSKCPQEKVWK